MERPTDSTLQPSPAPLLTLRGASKIYRMGEVEVPALNRADLEIQAGEFLVVIGPSGSGKSTLLNLIGGMDQPTSGEIRFGDLDLATASERQRTLYRRHEIGFVFQFYNLVPMLTALENVEVAEEVARDPLDPLEALRMVGLEDRASHFPSQLSGGQQQRVAIARALVGRPRLMLCDEPTGALDIETGRQVLGLLCDLNRDLGMTVVVISHNGAIARLGHRVAKIVDGRIVSLEENAERVGVDQLKW